MKQLTDEEINEIWNAGMTFKELVQAAYELGYQEHAINQENGIRRLLKDFTSEKHDEEWLKTQNKRNR